MASLDPVTTSPPPITLQTGGAADDAYLRTCKERNARKFSQVEGTSIQSTRGYPTNHAAMYGEGYF